MSNYCRQYNRFCEFATEYGYCMVTVCKKFYDKVIPSNGTTSVPFSTLKEYMADEQPTVDAVRVVRCKDCKYLDIINKAPVYACCNKHNHTFPLWEEDTREHFCSWGERK